MGLGNEFPFLCIFIFIVCNSSFSVVKYLSVTHSDMKTKLELKVKVKPKQQVNDPSDKSHHNTIAHIWSSFICYVRQKNHENFKLNINFSEQFN